ncbi:MAG TPA: sulfite exporter TauE/SafE family protein [Bryobacteraceae bacterium]|nr:sulfite exporter TauE/SafE family protein [Bryobacteraceae bacterium]
MASPLTYALLAVVAIFANAIRGLTGLGSAVIFVPFASMVWTAAMALAVSAVLDLVGNGYLCWLNRDIIDIPRAYWRVVGALTAGILVGSLFVTLNDKVVRHLTGSVILLTLVVIVFFSRRTLPTIPGGYFTAVGFLVGVISPVSGVPGPFVALMLTIQGKQSEITRLTPPVLLINAIVRIIGLIAVSRFDGLTLRSALIMVPFGLLGVYAGQRVGRNMPFNQLRYIIVGLVAVSGLLMVVR